MELGVGGAGVKARVGIIVSVDETTVIAGAHDTKIKATSKTVVMLLIFINYLALQGTAQWLALPLG
jgi:hypothetical protein